MNWKPGFVGAVVGTLLTRARTPWGPVIGGILGALFLERLFPQLRDAPKAAFTEPMFELAGGLAKADGHVSEAEIAMATSWMERFNLDAAMRKRSIAAFERGRHAVWRYEPACDSLRSYTHDQSELRLMVLKLLAEIAAVDAHASAQALLDAIAERLNVARPTWDGFRAAAAHAPKLAADYAVLQVTPEASDDEVKAAYRTLVARHHPDRLPPDASAAARRTASDKTSKLNAAYERIQRARGQH
ncbi:MAG: DnaJ domain-containing protein [Rhodanobacteraceae bacterium]|nr:DnaJ domain-containing protein [Rhodanobacteraceae bacterium]MBK7043726.1 DnaJ domain-containing protein [Rhodanobacteraceae bacterium]MBP9154850.1 DnaJ domain-containing protein [Xanthomonadales bacterium]HQW81294.1 DnaJ domain-containing protein [Pseudomonadota bacterium]